MATYRIGPYWRKAFQVGYFAGKPMKSIPGRFPSRTTFAKRAVTGRMQGPDNESLERVTAASNESVLTLLLLVILESSEVLPYLVSHVP
jgi:hypothetical protein